MNYGSIVRILSVVCVGLIFAFMAETVEAQRRGGGGRGGGGRGGGRSISRSGPAGGGSFRTSGSSYSRSRSGSSTFGSSGATQRPATQPSTRPSTQPSTRPSTQPSTQPRPSAQPSTRPSTGETRPGTGTGENRPSQRPGEGTPGDTGNREDWQQHRDEIQQGRQDYANNAREDWQDFYEEGGGGYYYGGYYGYPHTTVVITSMQFSSMQSDTGCTLSEVSVNGVRYYKCGSTWYNRVIDGTNVNYVVVSAPAGY